MLVGRITHRRRYPWNEPTNNLSACTSIMNRPSVTADDESFGHISGDVHMLAVEHGLSGYDAACLEFAIRKGLPLATLYEDLHKAAWTAGVEPFQPA
jgi:hypothetical protein